MIESSSSNKKVLHPAHKETATKETIKHYKRCKKVILSLCKQDDYIRSLIGDHWCWYKVDWDKRKAWLWIANEENYDFLTQNYRTLYWTLQLWTPEIANETRSWIKKPNGKWRIDKLKEGALGTRKETRLMGLSVDIDKAKGKEVTDPNVKKWLEVATKFFADYFKSVGFQSYALFFSGGGVYVMLHPALTTIAENEKHDVVFRWEVVQKCFDLFILDMEKRFFATHPEAKQWVKGFDRLNYDSKRQFKTPLSIHKKYPYAVIPLDTENPVIDFDKARLPISNELIEETAKCFTFHVSDIERLGKNVFALYGDQAKKEIEEKHPLNQSFDARPDVEELDVSKWSPCARNIYSKVHFDGPGATRSLAFLANYMRFVGVPRENAYQIFIKKASEWGAEISNIFESWFDCDGELHCFIPSCEHFNIEGSGFPNMEFGGLGFCTPDDRCNEIKHPLQYHKKEEKEAQIPLKYKDKDFGELKLEKVKNGVLVTIKRDNNFLTFKSHQRFDFWTRDTIVNRLFKYIKDELGDQYPNFLSVIKPQIEDRIKSNEKTEEKNIKPKKEYSEGIKEKAFNLSHDPKLLLCIKQFLEKFGVIHGKSKKVVVGEDQNKLAIFIVGVSSYMNRKLHLVVGGPPGAGKTRLTYVLILLFSDKMIDIYRLSERAMDYFEDMDFDGKIILIKEMEGGKSALYSLRIVIDPETNEMKILTVEKDPQTNKQITVERNVRGQPVFCSTTTQTSFDSQFKDRIFLISPDESEEQTKRINNADDEQRSFFPPDITEEYDTIKCFLDHLKPLKVKIPFKINYPTNKLKYRRTRIHLLNLIETIAFIHQYQRLHFLRGGVEYIIASEADFKLALSLAKKMIEVDILDVSEKALKLEPIFLDYGFEYEGEKEINKGLTMKEIREHVSEYLGKTYSRPIIRNLLEELDNSNRIVSDDSRPKRWYYLKSEEREVKDFESSISLQSNGEEKIHEWLNSNDENESNDRDMDMDIHNKNIPSYVVDPINEDVLYTYPSLSLSISTNETGDVGGSIRRTDERELKVSKSYISPSFSANLNKERAEKQEKEEQKRKVAPRVVEDELDKIKELEEIFKEQYEHRGIGKCSKCGKDRGLFERNKKKLCAVCLQKAIIVDWDNSVEFRSADASPIGCN